MTPQFEKKYNNILGHTSVISVFFSSTLNTCVIEILEPGVQTKLVDWLKDKILKYEFEANKIQCSWNDSCVTSETYEQYLKIIKN